MIDSVTPYFYHGEGIVFVAGRNSSGRSTGYKQVGHVSNVLLNVKEDTLTHFESQTNQAGRDLVIPRSTTVDLTMGVFHLNPENLALFLGLGTAVIPAGSNAEVLSVSPGFCYPVAHAGITALTLTGVGGAPLYVAGTHYNVNLGTGMIEIIGEQPETNPITTQDVLATYTYSEYTELEFGVSTKQEYAFRFDGLNIAESNKSVVLECHRVGFSVLQQMQVKGPSSSKLEVRGMLLRDTSKTTGSQFFTEKIL